MEIDDEEEGEERQALKVANQFFKIEKGKQFGLYSGKHIFYLASPEKAVAEEWISTLQTTLAILYQKSPIFSQEFLRISLMDGTFTTMPMDETTKTRDVIASCARSTRSTTRPSGASSSSGTTPGCPAACRSASCRTTSCCSTRRRSAWEQAARKKFGLVTMVPQSAFQLVLRKQTSLLPQARTKKEQHLEFCQALADIKEGRFTTSNKSEIFELAALAIFKDLHEGMSEAEQEEELILEAGPADGAARPLPAQPLVQGAREQEAFRCEAAARRLGRDDRQRLQRAHARRARRLHLGQGLSQVRKIVAAFRMETELNAVAATRMFIERVRLAPLCFSAQYIAEMWSVDKILKVLVVINYGGLHIYRLGASPLLLSTFDFNTLVSWQSMNDMLIINIIYAAQGEVAKRREKLRFLTRESLQMRTLLSKYGGGRARRHRQADEGARGAHEATGGGRRRRRLGRRRCAVMREGSPHGAMGDAEPVEVVRVRVCVCA